jgi:hypothetical protein
MKEEEANLAEATRSAPNRCFNHATVASAPYVDISARFFLQAPQAAATKGKNSRQRRSGLVEVCAGASPSTSAFTPAG